MIDRFNDEGGGNIEAVGHLPVVFRGDHLGERVLGILFLAALDLSLDLRLTFEVSVRIDDIELVG